MKNYYILVNEEKPNSFEPIYWIESKDFYNLERIDSFTSSFSKDDFIKYLIDNKLVNGNINLQILFNNNGIRKLKDGVIFKEDYNMNMYSYIIKYILEHIKYPNIINELYQKIIHDKTISDLTKSIIKTFFDNRHLEEDEVIFILEELNRCPYSDIRSIYYFIVRELETKENKQMVLKKDE